MQNKTDDKIAPQPEQEHGLSALQFESGQGDPLFLRYVERILGALSEMQEFDAFDVFIRTADGQRVQRLFHTGELEEIWTEAAYAEGSLLHRSLYRGEQRVVNLPNRRLEELGRRLKEKAFGQVLCLPIQLNNRPVGVVCAAHTRRKFFSEQEIQFLDTITDWIAGMINYEQENQRIRTQIISEERERIGMDLHDGIIQSLYGIGLSLENARLGLVNKKGNAIEEIEKSKKALEDAIADIRAYILDLRPRQLRHSNLMEGMQSLIREVRANTLIEVELSGTPDDVEGLAKPQQDAIYHIFQESLSNTAKHAKATHVSVRLWRLDDQIYLRIKDDGVGFEESKPSRRIGHGLANMQARAEGVGGGLEVVPIRRQGTTLTAWMPFIRQEEHNG